MRRFDHEMGEHLDDLLELSLRGRDVAPTGPARGGDPQHRGAEAAHPGDPRAGRARAAAARRAGQRDHGGVRHPAVEAHRRPAQAVRGRDRARRAGRTPRGRLLHRVPAQERRGLEAGATWLGPADAGFEVGHATIAAGDSATRQLWPPPPRPSPACESRCWRASVSNVDSTTPSRSFVMSRRWSVSSRRSSSKVEALVDAVEALGRRRIETLAHLLADALQDLDRDVRAGHRLPPSR